MRAFRIVVVDDHVMVRQGLKSRLQNYSHLELVGEWRRIGDFLAALLHPAVIVMDIDRPTMNGIEALISKEAAVHKFGSLPLSEKDA